MRTLTVTTTFGKKVPRSLSLAHPVPSTIEEWTSALGEEGVLGVLSAFASSALEAELHRIMARDPDLTAEDAGKHFQALFQFGKDMAKVEKAAKLRAQLESLTD